MTSSPPRTFRIAEINLRPALFLLTGARLALALTTLPDALKYEQQLSSPLTSHLNLQEGIYLFNHGIDPYSGGAFRHSPLFLALFTTILPASGFYSTLLWTFCDTLGAWAMVQIWRSRQRVSSSHRDVLIAFLYIFNPYILLPSLARSTSSFENTLLLMSVMFACQSMFTVFNASRYLLTLPKPPPGKPSPCLLALSFLVHLSLSSVLVLLPLLLILVTDPTSHLASPQSLSSRGVKLSQAVPLLGEFVLYFLVFTLASTVLCGGWSWVSQTWGASLTLPDLTPNTGLWWYFFTEMFDHFRPFFLMAFSVHLLIYIAPICIKFQYDPLYATFLLVGILSIFKAYPTLSDPGLFLSMISLFPETYPFLRHPIVTALLHLHASLLMPLFNHLWLTQGTGNANFYYASTLVFACSNGAALIDSIWAGLRVAIGKEKDGYTVVQE